MAASTDERNRILHLVEAGKVTAEEAARLLDTLDSQQDPINESRRKRTVRVRVTNLATNRQKATVTIPVSLIEVGLRLGTRLVPQIRGDLSVRTWKEQAISVETEGHGTVAGIHPEGDTLTIIDCDRDIKLIMPEDAGIKSSNVKGDVAIEGIRRVELESIAGDATI